MFDDCGSCPELKHRHTVMPAASSAGAASIFPTDYIEVAEARKHLLGAIAQGRYRHSVDRSAATASVALARIRV
jgi:hypothetical protein